MEEVVLRGAGGGAGGGGGVWEEVVHEGGAYMVHTAIRNTRLNS